MQYLGKNIFFEYNQPKDQFTSYFTDKVNELTRNQYNYYNTIEADSYLKMYFNCKQSGCQSACFGLFDKSSGLGQIFKNRIEHNHIVVKTDNDVDDNDNPADEQEDLSDFFKKFKVI